MIPQKCVKFVFLCLTVANSGVFGVSNKSATPEFPTQSESDIIALNGQRSHLDLIS
jgi:hypothetical protein